MNEELKNQWEQDLKDYGDKAHLMYKIPFKTKGLLPLDAPDNSTVVEYFDEVQSKNSAELPFDLERAKDGDEVEYRLFNENDPDSRWIWLCSVNAIKYFNKNPNRTDLRMKFPPKVKP